MKIYQSNGKLLLTGEYVILDGAKSLAIPTKFGQNLMVTPIKEKQLIWKSFTHTGICWFKGVFELPKLRLISCTFDSDKEKNTEFISEILRNILQEAIKINPNFLQKNGGFIVKTILDFSRNWGLGSSSTLINNIASWANVNAYKLLWNTFSGSGYDIACAQNNHPILYQLKNKQPKIIQANFNPNFVDELYFIHLNKKQNSREGIAQYNKQLKEKKNIDEISLLTDEFIASKSIAEFKKILIEHEKIISSLIKLLPIKKQLFSDYFGEVKSLGAWGGDFILATGNEDTPSYFKKKGYKTIFSYQEMILKLT